MGFPNPAWSLCKAKPGDLGWLSLVFLRNTCKEMQCFCRVCFQILLLSTLCFGVFPLCLVSALILHKILAFTLWARVIYFPHWIFDEVSWVLIFLLSGITCYGNCFTLCPVSGPCFSMIQFALHYIPYYFIWVPWQFQVIPVCLCEWWLWLSFLLFLSNFWKISGLCYILIY